MILKGRKSHVLRTMCPSANLICWNCTLTLSTYHWSMVLSQNDGAPPSPLCLKRIQEVHALNVCGLYTYLKRTIIFAWSDCGAAAWYIMAKILAPSGISRMDPSLVDKLLMLFIRKPWCMTCHVFFARPLRCLTTMLQGGMTALSLLFWLLWLYVLACLGRNVACRWWLWHWWNTLSKQCMVYPRHPIGQHNPIVYLVLDRAVVAPPLYGYLSCWCYYQHSLPWHQLLCTLLIHGKIYIPNEMLIPM